MVPSGMKIRKEQLNVLACADDIVLIGKFCLLLSHQTSRSVRRHSAVVLTVTFNGV